MRVRKKEKGKESCQLSLLHTSSAVEYIVSASSPNTTVACNIFQYCARVGLVVWQKKKPITMASSTSTPAAIPALPFSPIKLRSYVFRLPFFTRMVLLVIILFWALQLANFWNVVEWGALTPSRVGIRSCMFCFFFFFWYILFFFSSC